MPASEHGRCEREHGLDQSVRRRPTTNRPRTTRNARGASPSSDLDCVDDAIRKAVLQGLLGGEEPVAFAVVMDAFD